MGPGHELEQTLVKEGRVRVVYKDFAFLDPESVLAAEAASCAGEQGKFW
ncbi:MAG: thioredoxin domain-containing protein, partial [Chloroflexi bacterium]|nr:thioredoxin domain-containing protein [Chloroflexota bacterium]